jgi:hypothetical protein
VDVDLEVMIEGVTDMNSEAPILRDVHANLIVDFIPVF